MSLFGLVGTIEWEQPPNLNVYIYIKINNKDKLMGFIFYHSFVNRKTV